MPALSYDQVRQLNSYSIFTEEPDRPLFTLANLHKDFYLTDFRNLMMGITNAATETAAISHFGRRYGMFVAMQFYMLTTYDEVWDGKPENLRFAIVQEYGIHTLGMYINPNDFRYVEDDERERVVTDILYKASVIIGQLRKTTTISPLILWENIFGYMLWHYHTLLENPALADRAFEDLELLEGKEVWRYFSDKSLFLNYTGGKSPSALINQPVRKSCCFSKDIPGLMACGFCPIK
ncbi:Fe-S oxidoreductase [Solibacillus sp. A46]|uniref:Fe-S oxidoreductase n=1 Tax=Solibacillus faecavium TaxID=2762221 RepID=A0ABR8Y252_9BACL|nr:Fe-S oxidoreductase [Solibacillus faecavium]MBD8038198.1 Fe-S oxidoreductase [Solibacillus faecavium]